MLYSGHPKRTITLVFPILTANDGSTGSFLCFGCLLPPDPPCHTSQYGTIFWLRSLDDKEEWILTTERIRLLRAFIVSTGLENVFTATWLIRDY